MSAAVPMATTSAPRAIALAMSADERIEPAAMIEARLRIPSSRRARAPAKAVEVHVVGAGVDDSGGDRGDVVHGRDLHAHRLVTGGFLDRVDQLAQVLDRVDVVVRRRRNGVRAARDTARGGAVSYT